MKNRVFPYFPWERTTSRSILQRQRIEHAAKNGDNVVILDTAGRLHIDEDMMDELVEIKETVDVDQTLLVVDAMTGQDAVNVASMFNDKIGIDGVILTKDGWRYARRCGPFYQGGNRKADSLCRYGREAFRFGTVLPGPYGFPNPGHGRCSFHYRQSHLL